jgi:asparagine synthase (glutamine-hydrolysing)
MCCVIGYAGHDLPKETFTEYLMRTASRGPDDHRVVETEFGLLGFGRLAIMGLTPEGMQPFFRGNDCVVCNGELYGFRAQKKQLEAEGYTFRSDSDCEIILPLYYKYGLEMFRHLDAEFAMILYDSRRQWLIAARDPIGIRPLFYGYSESGKIAFASEAKNLEGLVRKIYPFPIGSYYCNGKFVRYCDIADTPAYCYDEEETVLKNIREKLIAGVDKRLDADTPVGFLLSGGLDSSLVCAIAAKKTGQAHPYLCHRHERGRHRPEICQTDGGLSWGRSHRGYHQPGDRTAKFREGHFGAGHLGYHDHPRFHGYVSDMQGNP